jgi:hypothetical protein
MPEFSAIPDRTQTATAVLMVDVLSAFAADCASFYGFCGRTVPEGSAADAVGRYALVGGDR